MIIVLQIKTSAELATYLLYVLSNVRYFTILSFYKIELVGQKKLLYCFYFIYCILLSMITLLYMK